MNTPLLSDSRFALRSCPFCHCISGKMLFDLRASQFCSANWTYSNDYSALLNIPSDAPFPVDQCGSCGFIYARYLPIPDFLSDVYEKVISYEHCQQGSENSSSYARRLSYLSMLIALTPHKTSLSALDYGCGMGVSMRILQALSVHTVGYDPSPMRNQTVQQFGITVDNEQKIKRHAPFDIIVCDNVLEHLADPAKTLDLLASLCNPKAVMYVSVPNYEEQMVKKQVKALQTATMLDMTLNPWEHLNYFSLDHLDRLMNKSGFKPIEAYQLPGSVNVGIRPEKQLFPRLKNCLASTLRLFRYAVNGHINRTVDNAFYRFEG